MIIPTAMIERLKQQQPKGATFFMIPEDAPEEVVCEVARATDESWSLAIALIGTSKPHVHKETIEVYQVRKGILRVHIGNRRQEPLTLRENNVLTIRPGQEHWAEGVGGPAEVTVFTVSAWRSSDYYLA